MGVDGAPEKDLLDRIAVTIHRMLVERRHSVKGNGEATIDQAIRGAVDDFASVLSADSRQKVVERVTREATGLGPLEELLDDQDIEEVMVNGCDNVYIERTGRIEPVPVRFSDDDQLLNTIERILAPLGRRVDELSPMADARLPDGSRVNVVIPPLAVEGPMVSIRRFSMDRPGPDRLIELGTFTAEQAERLERAIGEHRSVLISGGTGSGKTTLLNALSQYIDPAERIITIEDAAELNLRQPHVVRLESRPPSIEGRGEVTIRDLLKNALRMRPDRILIGEVRGPEALDLLTALNTGHDGALSTVHASSAEDALRRLEVLTLMAGVGLPLEVIATQLRRGIDLVVHLTRTEDGSRKVESILEVEP
ncbi:MAG: CpaF family protein [Solirubrobacterales bacterium]